eukprot:8804957-Pyramimonas_sp.AAC.1
MPGWRGISFGVGLRTTLMLRIVRHRIVAEILLTLVTVCVGAGFDKGVVRHGRAELNMHALNMNLNDASAVSR